MAWQPVDTMTLRHEFVRLALQEGSNISFLCERFNISRPTGYKWISRFLATGVEGLNDLSRAPHSCPHKTETAIEDAVLKLRGQHQAWGSRKLRTRLEKQGQQGLPAPSTITAILRRNGKIAPGESDKHTAFERFEHPYPNDLWQMDFKGNFQTRREGRCHPLTVLDDHSRFNIVLVACADERTATVKAALIEAFRQYGLPYRMTMDNGSPWGNDQYNDLTPLTVWLIRNEILVSHSRPYHPQTQGKDERFHRTLLAEAIAGRQFEDLADCQRGFDTFRQSYNVERPHESLGMETPVTRYKPSLREYSETLPEIQYAPDDKIRRVQAEGKVSFQGRTCRVPKALRGQPVAFRPTSEDGKYGVYFCRHKLAEVNFKEPKV
jgi:transposase InsO family protein